MEKAIKYTLIFVLAAVFTSSAIALSASAPSITTRDLGINNPGLLPSNPVYFFKKWGRGLRRAFTFDPLKSARLELDILNEKAAEISKLVEIIPDNDVLLNDAMKGYLQSMQKITVHKELLDKTVGYTLKHIELFDALENSEPIIEKLLVILARAFQADTPGNFRLKVRNLANPLAIAGILDRLERKLPIQSKLQLTRAKEDLLLNFAAHPTMEPMPDKISSLRILDELRIKIKNAKLKSKLNIIRQKLFRNLEQDNIIDKKIAMVAIRDADVFVVNLKRRLALAKTPPRLVDKAFNQTQFHLKQANVFYFQSQFSAAFSQAISAMALAKRALYFLAEDGDYNKELALLKIDYDKLKKPVEKIQDKIISFADFIKKTKIQFPNEKAEDTLVDIKLLLYEAR